MVGWMNDWMVGWLAGWMDGWSATFQLTILQLQMIRKDLFYTFHK
jgi:hypothetical protein